MIYYKNAVQQTAQVPHIAPQNYYKFGYLRSLSQKNITTWLAAACSAGKRILPLKAFLFKQELESAPRKPTDKASTTVTLFAGISQT